MSWSFWINVVVALASLWNAWLDHGQTHAEFRQSSGSERVKKRKKFYLLWGIPILAVVAIPFTAAESITSDQKADKQSKRIDVLTTNLSVATSEMTGATQEVATLRLKLAEVSPRILSPEKQQKLLDDLKGMPKLNFAFNLDPRVDDAEGLAESLAEVMVKGGFKLVGVERVERNVGVVNHGISVSVNGEPNSKLAADMVSVLNAINLNAHTPKARSVGMTATGFSDPAAQVKGVLYLDIGFR